MNDTVDTCLLTKSESRLQLLHDVEDDTLNGLETAVTSALAK